MCAGLEVRTYRPGVSYCLSQDSHSDSEAMLRNIVLELAAQHGSYLPSS
jgi:hypothetical protein